MNRRSGRRRRALEVVHAQRERARAARPRAGSAGEPLVAVRATSARRPRSATRPTADMPSASRSGSPGQGTIECRHRPPPPGCHSSRVGCSHSARLSSQRHAAVVALEQHARDRRPRTASRRASPATIAQMRSSACVAALGQRDALGLLPLARGVLGVPDLRPVERRRHRGEQPPGARVAHRVLDRLAGERARRDLERRRPARPPARTGPSSFPPAARSSRSLQRWRGGRRPGRRDRPGVLPRRARR